MTEHSYSTRDALVRLVKTKAGNLVLGISNFEANGEATYTSLKLTGTTARWLSTLLAIEAEGIE